MHNTLNQIWIIGLHLSVGNGISNIYAELESSRNVYLCVCGGGGVGGTGEG